MRNPSRDNAWIANLLKIVSRVGLASWEAAGEMTRLSEAGHPARSISAILSSHGWHYATNKVLKWMAIYRVFHKTHGMHDIEAISKILSSFDPGPRGDYSQSCRKAIPYVDKHFKTSRSVRQTKDAIFKDMSVDALRAMDIAEIRILLKRIVTLLRGGGVVAKKHGSLTPSQRQEEITRALEEIENA